MEVGQGPGAQGLDGRLFEFAVEELGATGKKDLGDVEDAEDRGKGDAQPLARGTQSCGVAGRDVGGQGALREPGLQAPDLAAGALRAAVGADRDVAELASGEVRTRRR